MVQPYHVGRSTLKLALFEKELELLRPHHLLLCLRL